MIMANSAFNKSLPHSCEYCVHGNISTFEKEVICRKHGITNLKDSCKSYKYDPLKRVPSRIKINDKFSSEDFSL